MKKYEILEHKADLKIRAFGRTKEELFSNALLGMSESMRATTKKFPRTITRGIKIKSPDSLNLLVDFLSEVIYLSQTNKEVYSKIKFSKFSGRELEGEIIGKKIERFGEDIKAVTYHDLDIHREKDGTWQATVLFDI